MTATGGKKRKVSKKNKKAWRKYVDMGDVDKFLENTRLEERLGSFAARENSELFVISATRPVLSKKQRRELLKSKEPKCFSILKPHTAVPDPISKRNRVRTREERRDSRLRTKEQRRNAQILKKRAIQTSQELQNNNNNVKTK
ncbi:ribosome biogenesis protein NOP53-like [Frieseomelitta varia]|uniref:ribosome biogenesis protein NOP53-like n=1 Tax=Frieseomelitta varia TaxID=561572 RepID=UPI001CB6AD39|nr:ribosome biogenesis protein NOP53-like [Frieseomelitta varia]